MIITELYSSDFNKSDLETQLEIFSSIDIQPSGRFLNIYDTHQQFKSLPDSQIRYLNQVVLVVKFILLMPSTNAVSERSVSAVHRIKTYFHTTMTQQIMSDIMIQHIHKHLTDIINHKELLNYFITANDEHRKKFWIISSRNEHLICVYNKNLFYSFFNDHDLHQF